MGQISLHQIQMEENLSPEHINGNSTVIQNWINQTDDFLNSLKTNLKGVISRTSPVLWENSNPNQPFNEQDVNISLNDYDGVEIIFKMEFNSDSGERDRAQVVFNEAPGILPVISQVLHPNGDGSKIYTNVRRFDVYKNKIHFHLAMDGTSSSQTPNLLIPIYIYGLKIINL